MVAETQCSVMHINVTERGDARTGNGGYIYRFMIAAFAANMDCFST
jgi:hypothetical protein